VLSTSDTTPNEDFCTTYELNLLQTGIGQNLTTNNLIPSIVNGLTGNTNLTKSLVCTKCAEGAYAVVRPQVNNQTQQLLDEYFGGLCGSSFQGAFLSLMYFRQNSPFEPLLSFPPSWTCCVSLD
jgi:hypothetical protein